MATKVRWAKGFKPPNEIQRLDAMTLHPGESTTFDATVCKFRPLPQPDSDLDWLHLNREDGQTANDFKDQCPWLSTRSRKGMRFGFCEGLNAKEKYPNHKIYLVYLCGLGPSEMPLIVHQLAEYTTKFFQLPTTVLPSSKLVEQENRIFWCNPVGTKIPIDSRFYSNGSQFHRQLKIDDILKNLRSALPLDAFCLVAVTMEDLYEDEPDLFVAGDI